MQLKTKIAALLVILVTPFFLTQMYKNRVARIIPNYIGFLSFSSDGFMAYGNTFVSGNVGPISIGMTEQEVDFAFRKNRSNFSKFNGTIYKDQGFIQLDDLNKKIYFIEKELLNVRYELLFREKKIYQIVLTSRLISK